MRRSDEFRRAVRRGRRAGSRLLVLHVLVPDDAPSAVSSPTTRTPDDPSRVGLVVGRGVGGSVVRSTVSRRLRHVMRDRLDRLPDGSLVVVRALAGAGQATSAALGAEVDRALDRVLPRPRLDGAA